MERVASARSSVTKKRSLYIIAGIIILVIIITIPLAIFLASGSSAKAKDRASLKTASDSIVKSLDKSVKPCKDFYQYACGNWANSKGSPTGNTNYGMTERELQDKVIGLLEKDVSGSSADVLFFKKCLDYGNLKKIADKPLIKLVKKYIPEWPILNDDSKKLDPRKFEELIVKLSLLKASPFFDIAFETNQTGQSIVSISAVPIDSNLNSTFNDIIGVFVEKPDNSDIMKSASQLLELEDARGSQFEPKSQDKIVTLGELNLILKHSVNWTTVLNDLLLASMKQFVLLVDNQTLEDAQLVNRTMELLGMIHQLSDGRPSAKLNSTGMERLKEFVDHPIVELIKRGGTVRKLTDHSVVLIKNYNFFVKTVITTMGFPAKVATNYIGTKLVSKLQSFTRGTLYGKLTDEKSKYTCVKETVKLYPAQVARRFIRQYSSTQTRNKANSMANQLKETFARLISSYTLMMKSSRDQAIHRLQTLNQIVSHPDWLTTEYKWMKTSAPKNTGSEFFQMAIDKIAFVQSLSMITWNFDKVPLFDVKTGDNLLSLDVDFIKSLNTLTIPPGMLQGPYFRASYPDSFNYATLGFAISRKLAIVINDALLGTEYLLDFKLDETVECFVNQTSTFMGPTNTSLSHSMIRAKNVLDAGAINLAFEAYRKLPTASPPKKDFTSDQVFFLRFAQQFCAPNSWKTEAPGRLTVNLPLANMKQFSRNFNCPSGSKMNPKEKCTYL